jgi:beta-galactosidase
MNGCVLSDRTREPGFYEVRHVFQNWKASASDDYARVTVRNKNYFRTGEGVRCRWTVLRSGEPFAAGEWKLHSLAPQSEHVYEVPAAVKDALALEGTVSLRVSFSDASGEIASDQIDFPNCRAEVYRSAEKGKISVEDSPDGLVLAAAGAEYVFSRRTGMIADIRTGRLFKNSWLRSPMVFDAFRAPSLNEVSAGVMWMKRGMHDYRFENAEIGKVQIEGSAAKFTTRVRAVPGNSVNLERYGYCDTKTADTGKKGDGPAFEVTANWTLHADGTLECGSHLKPDRKGVELARVGFRFTLDSRNPDVDYFAAGPFENYRDRRAGAFVARYQADAEEFFFPYSRPQDCGNREDARAVAFRSMFDTLGFAAVGRPFAFAVNPYSPLELVGSCHAPELPETDKCEFGIYAETRGLGGASCGPLPMKRDIITTDGEFRIDFAVGPRRFRDMLAKP